MPNLRRVLCTPDNAAKEGFDEVLRLSPRRYQYWYQDSVHYFNDALVRLGAKRLLYLDTDTYVCDNLSDLFEMLERYDFVGAHAPARSTTNTVGRIPPSFPEINIGVLAFRNAPVVEALFRGWEARYDEHPNVYKNNDQGPLREALWHWPGRLYVLPPEYNMRWGFGGFAAYKVKVLHGRPWKTTYEAIEARMNAKGGMRGWHRGEIDPS